MFPRRHCQRKAARLKKNHKNKDKCSVGQSLWHVHTSPSFILIHIWHHTDLYGNGFPPSRLFGLSFRTGDEQHVMAKFHSSGLVWCRKWNARAAPALTGTGIRHQRLDMPFLTANEYRSSLRTSSTNRLSISSGVRVRMRDDLLAHFQASWLLFAWRVYQGEVIDRCFSKLAEHP